LGKEAIVRQETTILSIDTPGQGLHEVTGLIQRWVQKGGITEGLLTICCQYTYIA
jgi:thiamine phosphate synthase YjbQ (UPF0047 family)